MPGLRGQLIEPCFHIVREREMIGASSEVGDVAQPRDTICVCVLIYDTGQGRPLTASVTSRLVTYRFFIVLGTRLRGLV